eukprot:PITA_09022
MGQVLNTFKYHISEKQLNKIIDTTFDRLPGGSDGKVRKKTMTFDQFYDAILDIFRKTNEITGAKWAPPSEESVFKMLEEYDLDKNKEIDRDEFHAFVRKFSKHLVATYGRDMVIVIVAAPAAVMLTKRATEGVPYTVIYASTVATVAAALLVRYKFFSK